MWGITCDVEMARKKPSAIETAIEMEAKGLSHRAIETFRELCPPWWIPARAARSKARQALIAQSQETFPIKHLASGYSIEAELLLAQTWRNHKEDCFISDQLQGPITTVQWKVTMDMQVIAKDQELHTEVMLVLMPPHFLEHCQQPQFHYTVGVYARKDDVKGLNDNFGPL